MARHNAANWPSRSGGIASFRSPHAEIRLRFVGAFARGGLHAKWATNRRVKYAKTLRYSTMAGVSRGPRPAGGGYRRGIQSNPGRTIKDPSARRRGILSVRARRAAKVGASAEAHSCRWMFASAFSVALFVALAIVGPTWPHARNRRRYSRTAPRAAQHSTRTRN